MRVDMIPLRPTGDLPTVPAIIADAGGVVARRFLEFFTANIENANTLAAYSQAVAQFLRWCAGRRLALRGIEPIAIAAYFQAHDGSDPTKKQHLAAAILPKLVTEGMLPETR